MDTRTLLFCNGHNTFESSKSRSWSQKLERSSELRGPGEPLGYAQPTLSKSQVIISDWKHSVVNVITCVYNNCVLDGIKVSPPLLRPRPARLDFDAIAEIVCKTSEPNLENGWQMVEDNTFVILVVNWISYFSVIS